MPQEECKTRKTCKILPLSLFNLSASPAEVLPDLRVVYVCSDSLNLMEEKVCVQKEPHKL